MSDEAPPNARRASASELLKSLGLLVDGPALWGRPVPSRSPGIFVVELPAGLPDAPIDIVALRHWLEYVPDMTLDGERPTAEEVAKRLHEFWLRDEPVLYIGRSARQIGARINSMYATPLGDAKPHSGGHWLKTLSVLSETRTWWSETDAHEEYEDALLTEIARRNAGTGGSGSAVALPFANLMTVDGVAKAHGLLNSLRTEDADQKSGGKSGSRSSTSGKRATARGQAATRVRKPAVPKAPPSRPAAAPTLVSQDGLDKLTSELADLRTVQRPQIIERVATARAFGDLKENADYEYARKEQSFIEGRIQSIEQMLRNVEVIEHGQASDSVRLGSTVDVESDGERDTYVIVGSTEANPAAGRLSNNSPVGRALLGAHVGDEVSVDLPSGSVTYRVLEVR